MNLTKDSMMQEILRLIPGEAKGKMEFLGMDLVRLEARVKNYTDKIEELQSKVDGLFAEMRRSISAGSDPAPISQRKFALECEIRDLSSFRDAVEDVVQEKSEELQRAKLDLGSVFAQGVIAAKAEVLKKIDFRLREIEEICDAWDKAVWTVATNFNCPTPPGEHGLIFHGHRGLGNRMG
ncbi:MAG TPA: hypothetical protein PLO63_11575 [Syntrophales bacterium]|nr:hypothetical protein [Syntrophales bacterium]